MTARRGAVSAPRASRAAATTAAGGSSGTPFAAATARGFVRTTSTRAATATRRAPSTTPIQSRVGTPVAAALAATARGATPGGPENTGTTGAFPQTSGRLWRIVQTIQAIIPPRIT